jgi:hypothetical protein
MVGFRGADDEARSTSGIKSATVYIRRCGTLEMAPRYSREATFLGHPHTKMDQCSHNASIKDKRMVLATSIAATTTSTGGSHSQVTVNECERGDKDRPGVMDRKKTYVGPCSTRCDLEKAILSCKQNRIPPQLVNTLPCFAVPEGMAAPRSRCRRSSCIGYAMAISMEPPAMQPPSLCRHPVS